MTKLGSIGREVIGSDIIRLYDEDGTLITIQKTVGELYSKSPMLFEGYWKEPEKTISVIKEEYFSAGDMAYRDEDGFYYLVDRKANMIISGGENIFPLEVESIIESNPKVKDVAVIGVPHEKWGESVTAIVVLNEGQTATAEEITVYCRDRIAAYKVPKSIIFVEDADMPRASNGRVLHRVLRERYGKQSDGR
jgi:acyl-CoA synthetase (AMP-forming)/AMP-acid ligase II